MKIKINFKILLVAILLGLVVSFGILHVSGYNETPFEYIENSTNLNWTENIQTLQLDIPSYQVTDSNGVTYTYPAQVVYLNASAINVRSEPVGWDRIAQKITVMEIALLVLMFISVARFTWSVLTFVRSRK